MFYFQRDLKGQHGSGEGLVVHILLRCHAKGSGSFLEGQVVKGGAIDKLLAVRKGGGFGTNRTRNNGGAEAGWVKRNQKKSCIKSKQLDLTDGENCPKSYGQR